jgi:hypothetical protein
MIQPDGYMSPYTTLSYANGPGFLNHFTGNDRRPWKDVSKDFEKPIDTDIDFLQPSLWRGPGKTFESLSLIFYIWYENSFDRNTLLNRK